MRVCRPQVVDKLKGESRELAAANLAKSEEQGEIRNQASEEGREGRGPAVLCTRRGDPGQRASGA